MTETIELNEVNYCDQKPVTIELTFEEHEIVKDVIIRAIDNVDLLGIYIHELPEDSEIRQRYEMLESLSDKICNHWKERFGNAPYQN